MFKRHLLTLKSLQPISHGDTSTGLDNATNTRIFMRHGLMVNGSAMRVPDISENSLRSVMFRHPLHDHLLETLGIETGSLPQAVVNMLYSGGNLAKGAKSPGKTFGRWRGAGRMETGELYETAQSVAEALFAPEGASAYSIPRDLWEAGRENVGIEGVLEKEAPAQITETLAPIAHMLLVGLGELVPLGEAAKRAGIGHEGMRNRVEDGRVRAVRVGGRVLIPAEDLS